MSLINRSPSSEQQERAAVLRELLGFRRELRARPDQSREYVVEQVRTMARERGYDELVVDAMREVWPANGDGGGQAHVSAPSSKPPEVPSARKTKLPPRRDAKTRKGFDKFRWQDAFCAVADVSRETGLPGTTRLVLCMILRYMRADGTGAYPGQERIAKEAGLRLPAVKFHIELAVKRRWLKRTKTHRSRWGLGYEYVARVPSSSEGASSVQGTDSSRNRREDLRGHREERIPGTDDAPNKEAETRGAAAPEGAGRGAPAKNKSQGSELQAAAASTLEAVRIAPSWEPRERHTVDEEAGFEDALARRGRAE